MLKLTTAATPQHAAIRLSAEESMVPGPGSLAASGLGVFPRPGA